MRKIIVTEWITLDGFTSGSNNDMSFVGMFFNDEMGIYEDAIVSSADTLILGKTTYESFAGSWPHVPTKEGVSDGEKEYARKLNAMKKLVFSKSLEKVEWNGSTLFREIDVEAIKKMKEEEGKDMLIYGSASLIQQFAKLNLIDEYQLLIHPIALGSGKPLFKEQVKLKLIESKPFKSGVVLMKYEPA